MAPFTADQAWHIWRTIPEGLSFIGYCLYDRAVLDNLLRDPLTTLPPLPASFRQSLILHIQYHTSLVKSE